MTNLQKAALAARQELDRRKRQREKAELLKSNFAEFIRAAWPIVDPAMPLMWNWHIDAMAQHLQAVAEGQVRFLMINIGPGYAKSIIASVMFSAWMWAREPMTKIIAATYLSSLTIRDSIRARDLIASSWFQETFAPKWEWVKTNEDLFSNDLKGDRRALMVGGGATGFRADGQIFDDLLNAKDRHSAAARASALDWAIRTMSSRFNDMRKGWRVVIGQRLHEEDPYGAMLATGDYVHLNLPSEFESERKCCAWCKVNGPTTSIGFVDPRQNEGDLLFPELFTPAVIAQAKKDLGSYDYAGQHQQRPSPAEGGMFKRSYWRRHRLEDLPRFDLVLISVDCTFKEATESDFVSIQVWGFSGPRAHLLQRRHDKMGFTATKAAIKLLWEEFKPSATLIEDKANGTAVIEQLSAEIPGVIAIQPEGGKVARAWAAQPTVEAGGVYLPVEGILSGQNGQDGAEEVIEECAAFPNGKHDDDVDAMTQALNWHREHGTMAAWVWLDVWSAELLYDDSNRPVALYGAGGSIDRSIAISYGTSLATVFIDIIETSDGWWVDRELYFDPRQNYGPRTDPQHADALKEFMAGFNGLVVNDPKAVTFSDELHKRGIFHTSNEEKELDAIRTISSLFRSKKLRIHRRCHNLLREIQAYAWDVESGEEKPVRRNDRACRALQFWAVEKVPSWKV